jgi:cobaltochelatase CobS
MAYHASCYNTRYGNIVQGFAAKYKGTCDICREHIRIGEPISWSRRSPAEGMPQEPPDNIPRDSYVARDRDDSKPDADVGKQAEIIRAEFVKVVSAWKDAFHAHQSFTKETVGEIKVSADAATKRIAKDATEVAIAAALESLQGARKLTIQINELPAVEVGVQHRQFPILVKAMAARTNIWLAGPSGSGKTTAAMHAARALSLKFYFTGAISDAYGLTGYNDANGRYVRTAFRDAWENGGVFLWDEVDASDPTALLAFNAALANGHAAFPDGIIAKHPDCILVAAANTYGHGATQEYVGRMKLDAAFLKRFAFLSWDYDDALEMATAPNSAWTKRVQAVRKKVIEKKLRVLVTPRESYIGAQLLAAGIPQSDVEAMTIRSGMTAEQWKEVG